MAFQLKDASRDTIVAMTLTALMLCSLLFFYAVYTINLPVTDGLSNAPIFEYEHSTLLLVLRSVLVLSKYTLCFIAAFALRPLMKHKTIRSVVFWGLVGTTTCWWLYESAVTVLSNVERVAW